MICVFCGKNFTPCPRWPNSISCFEKECQLKKKTVVAKKRRQTNREEFRKKNREYILRTSYGTDSLQVDAMFMSQKGKCLICENALSSTLSPRRNRSQVCVDHNHHTNKIRGLLCRACNMMLGYFKEDISVLTRVVLYLEGKLE